LQRRQEHKGHRLPLPDDGVSFSIEGRRAQGLFVDGRFIDELYMAALLPGQNPADPPAGTPGQRTA
jgi:hypothetical protein